MITPLNDKIVLKYIEPDVTTKSGLIIIDSRGENTDNGIVVAVNSKSALSVNDKVLYEKHKTLPFNHDGESYLLIAEDDILAVS